MSAIPRPVSCSNEALTCHLLQSTRKHKKKQNMTTFVCHLSNLISWIRKGGNVAHQFWQTNKIAQNQTHPSRAASVWQNWHILFVDWPKQPASSNLWCASLDFYPSVYWTKNKAQKKDSNWYLRREIFRITKYEMQGNNINMNTILDTLLIPIWLPNTKQFWTLFSELIYYSQSNK